MELSDQESTDEHGVPWPPTEVELHLNALAPQSVPMAQRMAAGAYRTQLGAAEIALRVCVRAGDHEARFAMLAVAQICTAMLLSDDRELRQWGRKIAEQIVPTAHLVHALCAARTIAQQIEDPLNSCRPDYGRLRATAVTHTLARNNRQHAKGTTL